MRNHRQSSRNAAHAKKFAIQPKAFIFFDKKSGMRRFEVKAGADGRMPIEHATDMLAMHCLARRLSPSDFSVMVGVNENFIESLGPRAKKIIQACLLAASPVQLSARQEEVMRAILQGLTNKEIASRLHISVRTIKFHVSLLLEKFEVKSRWALMRKAADLLSDRIISAGDGAIPAPALDKLIAESSVRSNRVQMPARSVPFSVLAHRHSA